MSDKAAITVLVLIVSILVGFIRGKRKRKRHAYPPDFD